MGLVMDLAYLEIYKPQRLPNIRNVWLPWQQHSSLSRTVSVHCQVKDEV